MRHIHFFHMRHVNGWHLRHVHCGHLFGFSGHLFGCSGHLFGFNRAAPRPPTRKNREPSPGKIGGPPPGKYENPDFRIFEQFLDFWFFYGRFGPREGFHGLPRTRAIIFHPLMPQTDPPRPNSAPKLYFSTYLFITFPNFFEKITSHTNPQTKPIG